MTLLAGRPAPLHVLSGLPVAVNLAVYRGDRFTLAITVTDTNGNPYDLTGHTVAAQIRATPETDTVAGTFSVTVTANTITLELTAAVAAALPAAAVWDVQITDTASNPTTLAGGAVIVTDDVTRP